MLKLRICRNCATDGLLRSFFALHRPPFTTSPKSWSYSIPLHNSRFFSFYSKGKRIFPLLPAKNRPETDPLMDTLRESIAEEMMLNEKKISSRASPDALFKECLDEIWQAKRKIDPDVNTEPSEEIAQLSKDELEITRRIFKRVDPDKNVVPCLETKDHYIDPYWDPFAEVEKLKETVKQEFNDYARIVSAAESRRQRLYIRRSLREKYESYDPYKKQKKKFEAFHDSDQFPVPHKMEERFWDPSADVRTLLKNNNRPFSWRDTHLLHHFVGENGLILPRRVTFATRFQQKQIFRAICVARSMAVFPLDWKPTEAEKMPILDPFQFLADELTQRYAINGDRRAQAMIKILMEKYPDVNVSRYLRFEAQKKTEKERQAQEMEENEGNFSRIVRKYKREGIAARTTQYSLA